MTVAELIDVLKTFDLNEKVYCFPDRFDDEFIDSHEVLGVHKYWNNLDQKLEILIS